MQISMTSHESIPVLRVEGDVDMATASSFEAAVNEHSNEYRSPLLLDLTDCPFIDSGGLNVLLQAVRHLEDSAWLGVVGANGNLRRVFEIVGLTSTSQFRVFDDLAAVGGG
jgi:anti-anti-sigma factor